MTTPTFRLIDVSPDRIMDAALVAAERTHRGAGATTTADVSRATGLGAQQAGNALSMTAQLRLTSESDASDSGFTYIGDLDLRRSPKMGLPQFFREAAQHFPPFLLYLSYLARGFDPEAAARHAAAIFDIGLAPGRVETVFFRWGKYAGIVDDSGKPDFEPKEVLDFGFLARLAEALRDEVATEAFVMDELGEDFWARMYQEGIDVAAFARALTKYGDSPKDAIREVGATVESYLAQMSTPRDGPKSDIGKLSDFLSGAKQQAILRTHRNVGFGIAGLRNAADHGSDPDTGKDWIVTSEAALVGALLSMLLLKSIDRYNANATQTI